MSDPTPSDDDVVVHLLGLPTALHRRSAGRQEALRREFALILAASDEEQSVPARLMALSVQLGQPRRAFGFAVGNTLVEAIANGVEHVDVDYLAPRTVVDYAIELDAVLDEVDEFCAQGDLVTLCSPPESIAYRKWFMGEFIGQVRDGREPRRWQGSETHAPRLHRDDAAAVTIVVDEDLDLEGSARIRTEIATAVDAGASLLVIDLAACQFVDSIGISLLLSTLTRMRDEGGDLVVRNLSGPVSRTLTAAGVLGLLTEFDTPGA